MSVDQKVSTKEVREEAWTCSKGKMSKERSKLLLNVLSRRFQSLTTSISKSSTARSPLKCLSLWCQSCRRDCQALRSTLDSVAISRNPTAQHRWTEALLLVCQWILPTWAVRGRRSALETQRAEPMSHQACLDPLAYLQMSLQLLSQRWSHLILQPSSQESWNSQIRECLGTMRSLLALGSRLTLWSTMEPRVQLRWPLTRESVRWRRTSRISWQSIPMRAMGTTCSVQTVRWLSKMVSTLRTSMPLVQGIIWLRSARWGS